MKTPRLPALAFRVLAGVLLAADLCVTAFWMVTRSGPFPFIAERVSFGSPEDDFAGAMGITFLVGVVPCLALIVALYAVSDLPSLRQELVGLRAGSVEDARARGGEAAAKVRRELDDIASPAGRAATRARACAALGGGLAGILRQEWLGEFAATYGAVCVVVAFALAAVILDRGRGFERALKGGALVLIVLGVLFTTEIYVGYRPEFFLFELLIPIVVGMLPGFLVHVVASRRAVGGRADSAGRR